jgi:hypothetical protein
MKNEISCVSRFPVIGQGTLPGPQGPFVVTSKEPALINFKNVFQQTEVFNFSLDNADFALSSSRENIESKQVGQHLAVYERIKNKITIDARTLCFHFQSFDIIVKLKDILKQPDKAKTGKLLVTCDNGNKGVKIEWIYYLRGLVR